MPQPLTIGSNNSVVKASPNTNCMSWSWTKHFLFSTLSHNRDVFIFAILTGPSTHHLEKSQAGQSTQHPTSATPSSNRGEMCGIRRLSYECGHRVEYGSQCRAYLIRHSVKKGHEIPRCKSKKYIKLAVRSGCSACETGLPICRASVHLRTSSCSRAADRKRAISSSPLRNEIKLEDIPNDLPIPVSTDAKPRLTIKLAPRSSKLEPSNTRGPRCSHEYFLRSRKTKMGCWQG